MIKKKIAWFLLVVFLGMSISCVTKPYYSDYTGLEKSEALSDLNSAKTKNTVKLVCNWVIWGGPLTLWIASIVDTFNYVSYNEDFHKIERKIEAIPEGAKVGQ